VTFAESAVEDDLADLDARKAGATVAVSVPARNEAATIGDVVDTVARLRHRGLVDEVVVVDDSSSDDTALEAAAAGAVVIPSVGGPGKGQALTAALAATSSDLLVFVDADVTNFSAKFVTTLIRPLFDDPSIHLVKASYRRALDGRPNEGGRVTELLARPLLRRFFPPLAGVAQPLAGESAVRRSALAGIELAPGYGIEIGLLVDILTRFGRSAIAEVDLGERVHRNRPLLDLQPHADEVLAALLERTPARHDLGALR
jgi:glucosyl-3-phosphoglycerate synthase